MFSKIIKNKIKQGINLTLICGVHGDELFGERVFKYFENKIDSIKIQTLILAHPEAIKIRKRFFETDLNRSFPGSINGSLEEKIANKLIPILRKSDFVLDIHTTVSDIILAPVITNLNLKSKKIINLLPCKNIAFVQSPLGQKSLIGQTRNGISLEFNRNFARKNEAIKIIENIINSLTENKKAKLKKRNIFYIDGSISKKIKLPKNSKNFKLIKELNVYPFLLHKNSYRDIHALSASVKKSILC